MMNCKSSFEISNELLVYRHHNGIKLVRPDQFNKQRNSRDLFYTGHTTASILSLPLCVYFGNVDSKNLKINELTIEASGFISVKDAIGKTVAAVLKKESAIRTIAHDKDVMLNHKRKIIEQVEVRKDDINLHTLSIKLPWYGDNNDILGYLGCSIVAGRQSLSDSLSQVSQLGLLSPSKATDLFPGSEINHIYLSERETECLQLYTQGKTAKEIAKIVNLSHRTVENYIYNIKVKMSVSTKAELIHKTINYFD